jgi:hypothetical protein
MYYFIGLNSKSPTEASGCKCLYCNPSSPTERAESVLRLYVECQNRILCQVRSPLYAFLSLGKITQYIPCTQNERWYIMDNKKYHGERRIFVLNRQTKLVVLSTHAKRKDNKKNNQNHPRKRTHFVRSSSMYTNYTGHSCANSSKEILSLVVFRGKSRVYYFTVM